MATSSIFANFDIKDKKTAEAFVEALEASEKNTADEVVDTTKYSSITDPEEIIAFFAKRKTMK